MESLPSINFENANTWDPWIKKASEQYGVPFFLLKGLIATESSFNEFSSAPTSSARGLVQLTIAAASDVNADYTELFNPIYAIDKGAAYLALVRKRLNTNSWDKAIRAYYAGVGNELKYAQGLSINIESDGYLKKVHDYALSFMLKQPLSFFTASA